MLLIIIIVCSVAAVCCLLAISTAVIYSFGAFGSCACFAKRKKKRVARAVVVGALGGGGIRAAAAHVARGGQDPGAHPPHGRADGRGAALPGTAAAGADQGDGDACPRNALNSPGARPRWPSAPNSPPHRQLPPHAPSWPTPEFENRALSLSLLPEPPNNSDSPSKSPAKQPAAGASSQTPWYPPRPSRHQGRRGRPLPPPRPARCVFVCSTSGRGAAVAASGRRPRRRSEPTELGLATSGAGAGVSGACSQVTTSYANSE